MEVIYPEDFLQWHCHSAGRFLSATSQNPGEPKSFLPLYPFTDLPGTTTIKSLWARLVCHLPGSVDMGLVLRAWSPHTLH